MKNNDKTQGQLIKELAQLRQRIAELEQSEIEHRRDKQALKTTNERLQYLLTSTSVAIYTSETSGDYGATAITENVKQMTGYKPREFIENASFWLDHVHPEDRQRIVNELPLIFKKGKHIYEYRFLHKDGHYIWIRDDMKLIKDKSKNPIEIIGYWIDITERRRAKEALRKNERFLASIFNSIQDGISILDKDMNIVRVNAALEQWYAHNVPLVGKKCYNAYHDRDERCEVCPTLQTLQTGESAYEVVPKRGPRGKIAGWLDLYSFPMVDAATGKMRGVIEYVRDITERKQAEARAEHLKFVLLAIRGANQLITREKDRDCLIQGACDKLIETRGYDNAWIALIDESGKLVATAEAGLGESFLPLVEQLERGEPLYCTRMALAQAGALIIEDPFSTCTGCPLSKGYRGRKEMATRLEHGGKIHGLMTVSLPLDYVADEEEHTLFKEVAEDIAFALHSIELEEKRKRAEEVRQESEERFRLAFENANTGVCLVDLEGNLARVNNKMCEIFGYTKEELESMTVNDIAHPEDIDISPDFIKKTLQGEIDRGTFEKRYFHKKGHVVTCQVSSSLVRNSKGSPLYFISHVHDITDRKQAEVQRERALRETTLHFEISQALAGAQTEDEVLDVLIQHAGLYLQAFVVIFTFDRTGDEVAAIVRRQNPFESGLTVVVPLGGGLPVSRYTLFDRLSPNQPFISGNAGADERIEPAGREILGQTGAASFAMFPLTVGNEWMGLILVMAKPTNYFDEEKQHLYQTLVDQGAVALRAARLRQQIRESQQRFQGLVETLSDWIWEVDERGIYTYVSPRIKDLLGFIPEEILGRTPFDLMPPEEAARVKAVFESLVTTRQPIVALENTCCHKDGRLVVFETSGAPFFDAAGQIKGYRGVDRDITKRKQTEEALKERQETINAIIETSQDLIWAIDSHGVLTYSNPAMEKILGYRPEEILGRLSFDLIHPDDKKMGESILRECKEKRSGWNNFLLKWRHKDGTYRYLESNAVPILDTEGALVGFRGVDRDITERKQAEKALHESEARYRAVIESQIDLISRYLPDTTLTFVNEAYCQFYGKTREELIGRSFLSMIVPEFRELVKKETESLARNPRPLAGEYLNYRQDGEECWIQWVVQCIVGEDDRVVELQAVGRDITKRKQAEKELQESEERFRLAFENANTGVCLVDLEGNLIRVNNKMCEIFGYTKEELEHMTVNDIAHPEDLDKSPEFIKKTLQGEIDRGSFEKRYCHKKGHVVTCEVSSSLVRNAEGAPLYFISHVHDITDRKQAEEALRESEERFRTLVETMKVGLSAIDEKGVLTYVNEYFSRMLGYSIDEMIGRSTLDFYYDEEARKAQEEIFAKRRAGMRDPNPYEVTWRKKDGQKVYSILSPTPMFDANGRYTGSFAIHTDITERKKAEATLRESEDRFRIFADEISFEGIIIHDEGKILDVNRQFSKMHGYDRSELIGMMDSLSKTIAPEYREIVLKHIQEGYEKPYEVVALKKDGSTFPIEIHAKTIPFHGKMVRATAIRDITERKQAEEELNRSYEQMREMLITTVNALASTVEMKDQYTAGHQPRVTHLACAIATEMGLPEAQIEGIRMAGSIHDIGKIVVPAEILNKPGPLTEMQYEMIKMHPRAGYDILKGIAFPWPVAQIVLQHHERMDGSGYPQGLSGDEIMVEARILAVANVVEAMTSHRPYRAAYDIKEALEEISKNRGVLYDPTVADTCLRLFTEKGFTLD